MPLKSIALVLALIGCLPVFGNEAATAASISAAEKALKGKDYKTAFKLFKTLAEQGNPEAQANLGYMYEYGQGIDKDLASAVQWYRAAAEQGTGWAQTNLGIAYLNGNGVKKDENEAAKWFRKAALQGKTMAQEMLGALYNRGYGVSKERKEAVEWINPSNLMYIRKLEIDYKHRIHFYSPTAENLVRSVVIECNAPKGNGHHLPLLSLLYARLASADTKDSWIETEVQERDGEFRIVDSLRTKTGVLHTTPVFQLNKWGELKTLGSIRAEAVRNACFGSHGPIWLLEE
jgi:TPR repeat protein